jgi:hypothetical protein
VIVIAVLAGVGLIALGPGGCALSCVTSSAQVEHIVEACAEGETEACRAETGSAHVAEELGRGLPALADQCGSFDGFEQNGVSIEGDPPYRWTAEVRGHFETGTCGTSPPVAFRLVGAPWGWKMEEFGPPQDR